MKPLSDDVFEHFCPDCSRRFLSPNKAGNACPECHVKRVTKIHAHDTPSAEELGLIGQQGDYSALLCQQMRGKQRRVIRKSEPMGG